MQRPSDYLPSTKRSQSTAKRNKTIHEPSLPLAAYFSLEYRLSCRRLSCGANRIANHLVQLTDVHRAPHSGHVRNAVGRRVACKKRATKRNEIAGHYPGIAGRNRNRVITCEQRASRTRAGRWKLGSKHSVARPKEKIEQSTG